MRRVLTVIVGLALLAGRTDRPVAFGAAGDPVEPVAVLKKHGLERQRDHNSRWVLLAREAQVINRYRLTKNIADSLAMARRVQQQFETGDQNPQAMIDACEAQISMRDARILEIDQQLATVAGASGGIAVNYHNILVNERNLLVGEQRQLNAMIKLIFREGEDSRQRQVELQVELSDRREQFLRAVEDLHDLAGDVTAEYADLGRNREVAAALSELSASSQSKQRVEASRDLQQVVGWLERARGRVESETFTLRRHGGVDLLDVTLNGKGPVSMVFDTGAGPTAIPAGLAAQLGLKYTGSSVPLRVAGGSEVQAKVAVISSVKAGRLLIRNVECAVIPEGNGESPPLLGQSFLRNFDYKYTQKTARLVLTKVEPDLPVAPRGGTRRRGSSEHRGSSARLTSRPRDPLASPVQKPALNGVR
jgi:clan AA aspartic protease (TIGR02281 family)